MMPLVLWLLLARDDASCTLATSGNGGVPGTGTLFTRPETAVVREPPGGPSSELEIGSSSDLRQASVNYDWTGLGLLGRPPLTGQS